MYVILQKQTFNLYTCMLCCFITILVNLPYLEGTYIVLDLFMLESGQRKLHIIV